jgi:hypothetical protein
MSNAYPGRPGRRNTGGVGRGTFLPARRRVLAGAGIVERFGLFSLDKTRQGRAAPGGFCEGPRATHGDEVCATPARNTRNDPSSDQLGEPMIRRRGFLCPLGRTILGPERFISKTLRCRCADRLSPNGDPQAG